MTLRKTNSMSEIPIALAESSDNLPVVKSTDESPPLMRAVSQHLVRTTASRLIAHTEILTT